MGKKFIKELVYSGFKKCSKPDGQYYHKMQEGYNLIIQIKGEIELSVIEFTGDDFKIISRVVRDGNETVDHMINRAIVSAYMFE